MKYVNSGTPIFQFKKDPDNFIGVTLENYYTIGHYDVPSARQLAIQASNKQLEAEVARLSRYFHKPKVVRGEVEREVFEDMSTRGRLTFRLHTTMMIEITEEDTNGTPTQAK